MHQSTSLLLRRDGGPLPKNEGPTTDRGLGDSERNGLEPPPGQLAASSGGHRLHISSLHGSDSPRIQGEDVDHVERLAATEVVLPPILVHRQTMRVVDGMHRVRAALLRGEDTISVQFFDGSEQDAFVRAVTANTQHGLPLTRADREAAASRIIRSHPHYSDRRIAGHAGLAAQTIAAIRRRVTPGLHVAARVGKDGRVRPVNGADGRRIARDAITENPDASLREIARIAGISPATVRDVRSRMTRGEDPVALKRHAKTADEGDAVTRPAARRVLSPSREGPRSRTLLLDRLRKDPSLRGTEPGRVLLRSLAAHASGPGSCEALIDAVPPHALFLVAELARSCADEWLSFATRLEQCLNDKG